MRDNAVSQVGKLRVPLPEKSLRDFSTLPQEADIMVEHGHGAASETP
jgi:hypothetical protein